MQHSILYLFNPNDLVKIRNRSSQTKTNIFLVISVILKKKKKSRFFTVKTQKKKSKNQNLV